MNKRKAVCIERCTYSLVGGRWNRADDAPRQRPTQLLNRRKPCGWLPPSLCSRVGNVLTWTRRLSRWAPVVRLDVEQVRFDLHRLQDPEVCGVQYQQGERFGWEVRGYLLIKFGYRCIYCGKRDVPFELDHVLPKSRGGSDRVSNLVLCCHDCNLAKGNRTASEFGHPEVETQAREPLRDAAAVNATRFRLVEVLQQAGFVVTTWTGGRTRWNRDRFGMEKTHARDALCVGEIALVWAGRLKMLPIRARGRGDHCRTLWDEDGFPRGYKMRHKQVCKIATGDLVCARVPPSYKAAGTHRGRVAVRKNGFFSISTSTGKVDSVPARFCTVVQRADGYEYQGHKQTHALPTQSTNKGGPHSSHP